MTGMSLGCLSLTVSWPIPAGVLSRQEFILSLMLDIGNAAFRCSVYLASFDRLFVDALRQVLAVGFLSQTNNLPCCIKAAEQFTIAMSRLTFISDALT